MAGAGGLGINDTLPDQALSDPGFRQGTGQILAINQPELAYKYGVIRDKRFIPPAQLRGGAPGGQGGAAQPGGGRLSEETKEQLQSLSAHMAAAGAGIPQQTTASQQFPFGVEMPVASEAAARVGNVPGDDSSEPLTDDEKKRLHSNIDEFDVDTYRQLVTRDLLNNEEQRRIIESRLTPLDLADLIVYNRVAQDIIVRPNKFWFRVQNASGEEDLAVKRLIASESKSLEVSERYFLD